jgi:hypothetical protein
MKSISIVLALALIQCLLHELTCYKFRDSDLMIPARFMRRVDQYQLDDLILSANNRQKSLYPEAEESLASRASYQRALDAIAAQEAALLDAQVDDEPSVGQYSEELHLDDFIQDDDDEDDELKIDPKDEETESHSSLIAGHQYVSGKFNLHILIFVITSVFC